jgi:hypothetical protein
MVMNIRDSHFSTFHSVKSTIVRVHVQEWEHVGEVRKAPHLSRYINERILANFSFMRGAIFVEE